MTIPVFKLHNGFVPAAQIASFTRRNALPIDSGVMSIVRKHTVTIEEMGDGFDKLSPAEQGYAASRIAASVEILKAFGMVEQHGDAISISATDHSPLATNSSSQEATHARR